MRTLKLLGLLVLTVFVSCKDKNVLGDLIAPSDVKATYKIVGVDAQHPNGDGTGLVDFSVTANNAITFRFDFGDGKTEVSTSGIIQHRYTKVGTNKFTVVVSAVGVGGNMSSVPLEVEVYSSFSDVEAENMLAGKNVGESKTWYWAANVAGYAGLGPQESGDNGEYGYPAWWQAAPFDPTRTCMFENSFIFTRTANGITYQQTADHVFVPGAYASVLGVADDQCQGTSVIPSITGVKQVSFVPSTSKAATQGKYDNKAYRGTAIELSNGGMLGWWVGASSYDIISLTDSQLIVRVMQPNSQYAWYHIFTTTKPSEGSFTNLVWSDEFNKEGTPDATKWTYDLGKNNGWGNGELQTYTKDPENVKVTNGVLKITAKADGNGGYTSARLKTEGLYGFKYGKVEIKAKLPAAQGTWPAMWFLGNNFATDGWPRCGEIDLLEQKGQDKNHILGACHWYDTDNNHQGDYDKTIEFSNASADFHIYTMTWTEKKIIFAVDNKNYFEMDNNAKLPFNQKFFLIFNIAMGGSLGGNVAANFTEDSLEIDYVRIYQ
ncbi:hypothetical protein RCZ04_03270 [Capnocytophaga sp. HP1101]